MLFTHLINPFAAPAGSAAERSQRVTFAALRRALAEVPVESVELIAAAFPDDLAGLEKPAIALPPLTRRVGEVAHLAWKDPLPIFAEVLSLAALHGRGEYVIFTNMDICPQPYFYTALAAMVRAGEECAYVIPRRTIASGYDSPDQLPAMYAEAGQPHEGFDCFIFPRAWIGRFDLGDLCIGAPDFDLALILNLEVLTGFKTKVLWNQFLTFHIGDDKPWCDHHELNDHNSREAKALCARLEQRVGKVPSRSNFQFIKTWLMQEAPPPASRRERLLNRARQISAEWRNRWLVRRFRRELGQPGW